jgi:SanA protein
VTGVAADQRTYSARSIAWSELREVPATFLALADIVRREPPPILGEPAPIP